MEQLTDQVRGLMQVARRSSLDVSPYGPEAVRAVNLERGGDRAAAQALLLELRARLIVFVGTAYEEQAALLERKLTRFAAFTSPANAQTFLEGARAALAKGDFVAAQPQLRRLEGEVGRMEEELGALGGTLGDVDDLVTSVEKLGGDTSGAVALQGRALEAATKGDKRQGEALLVTAAAMLIDTLAPLLANELIRLSKVLQEQRTKGRDVRSAVGLIRQMTLALRSRNYRQGLVILGRLQEDTDKGEAELAAKAGAAAPPKPARSRGRARTTTTTTTATGSSTSASTSTPVVPTAEPATPVAPAPPVAVVAPAPAVAAPSSTALPPIKPGSSYLFLEARAKRARQVFLKLRSDKKGLFLTTTFPPKVSDEAPLPETEMVWLSEASGWSDTLNPKTLDHEVSARVLSFLKSDGAGVLALDGLAYLVSLNGFDKVEKFLKTVLDVASSKDVSLVVTLVPSSLDPKNQARVEGLFDHVA